MFAVKLMKKRGVSTKGGVGRMRRDSIEGKGLPAEFYEKAVQHPHRGLGDIAKLEGLKVKTSRPKKYISLNF